MYSSKIDHSDLLKSRTWYNFLFLLDPTDYKSWAAGLLKAGYATDTLYAQKLIDVIERYKLHELDQDMPEAPPVIFAQTIGINAENEAVLNSYHNGRMRGESPALPTNAILVNPKQEAQKEKSRAAITTATPSAQANDTPLTTASATNPADASVLSSNERLSQPTRSAQLPQSGIMAMETAFSQAEAVRPAGSQRQNLSGAPVVAIKPQEINTANIDPRRPAKANETPKLPTQTNEAQPLANNNTPEPSYNTPTIAAAYTESTQMPETAPAMTYTNTTTISNNSAPISNELQYVKNSENQGGYNSQAASYQPQYAAQAADAPVPAILTAYHSPAPATAPMKETATVAKNSTNSKPELTYINERRAVIYPYSITLSEVAAKHDTEMNLLKNYNKDLTNQKNIAAGAPIFLQAPFSKAY